MAYTSINTKISIILKPSTGEYNMMGEANKIMSIANQETIGDSGAQFFTSTTSGLTYDTSASIWSSYPEIYNKGDLGLYNMFVYLYGTYNGPQQIGNYPLGQWIFTSDDNNTIKDDLDDLNNRVGGIENGTTPINATSAQNLNNLSAGSATQPVYFNGGVPVECTKTPTTGIHQIFTEAYSTSSPTAPAGMANGDILVRYQS